MRAAEGASVGPNAEEHRRATHPKVGEKWKNPHSGAVYEIVEVIPQDTPERTIYNVVDLEDGQQSGIRQWHIEKYKWVRVGATHLTAMEDCECGSLHEAQKRADRIGKLRSPRSIYDLCAPDLAHLTHEEFYIVGIGAHGKLEGRLVCYQRVAHGGQHKVEVEVEQIAQALLKDRPDIYILVHCHPSGDAKPSDADVKLTESIRKGVAAALPKCVFGDHIIVTKTEFYSFTEDKKHHV